MRRTLLLACSQQTRDASACWQLTERGPPWATMVSTSHLHNKLHCANPDSQLKLLLHLCCNICFTKLCCLQDLLHYLLWLVSLICRGQKQAESPCLARHFLMKTRLQPICLAALPKDQLGLLAMSVNSMQCSATCFGAAACF